MSDNIIKVEGLGKKYLIGHENQESYTAMRDIIAQNVKNFGKNFKALFSETGPNVSGDIIEEFWALKDINFEVKQGDAVGIIGRNGAGKSTLLKVLSRITDPTKGRIEIRGRMSSLLEVGTGFHPELSGRENIFLNGAILGMSRQEIRRKFDEIVDFSGVEKFLDTPVKRYSSGMYVRLAFAVAAHLESEILIVDEVLAVGDAEFQKKCLGKMGEVSKGEGRTVLFVSHNMAAISSLCDKAIVLKNGSVDFNGNVEPAMDHYLDFAEHNTTGFSLLTNKKSGLWKQPKLFSRLISIESLDHNNKRQNSFRMGSILKLKITFEITELLNDIELGVFINGKNETLLGLLSSFAEGYRITKTGGHEVNIEIDKINLMPGDYTLGIWITQNREVDDAIENALDIQIISNTFTGNLVDFERYKHYGTIVRSSWY